MNPHNYVPASQLIQPCLGNSKGTEPAFQQESPTAVSSLLACTVITPTTQSKSSQERWAILIDGVWWYNKIIPYFDALQNELSYSQMAYAKDFTT